MIFRSFWMAGFECSCHRRGDGRRLDVIAATGHDRFAAKDYARARRLGMETVRDGARWHLIERSPGRYDFSSLLPMVRAAREAGVQVIWDLCHYGWPDDLDIFAPAFVDRFARLARAFVQLLREETDEVPFLVPINEPSFLAWAGGDLGGINPFAEGRGNELKSQLIRATIAGIEAIRDIEPRARICQVDPVFHVVPRPDRTEDGPHVEAFRRAQYAGWDMLSGRLHPELGGRPEYLDIIGVNYYLYNQWVFESERAGGPTVRRGDPRYRPFREMLAEIADRYGRPMFVAETGTEAEARADWLQYVADEALAARGAGVPVHGLCWYPIVNFPGWDNDRHCLNGLWDYADDDGRRPLHEPLAHELRRQQARLALDGGLRPSSIRD